MHNGRQSDLGLWRGRLVVPSVQPAEKTNSDLDLRVLAEQPNYLDILR